MKTIDDVIQKLEYILEGDPRTFSNPECEYGWVFNRVNEAIKMLKEIEKDMPSAQPEIIRCKDCRNNHWCNIQEAAMAGDNFFCGAAERRTDE